MSQQRFNSAYYDYILGNVGYHHFQATNCTTEKQTTNSRNTLKHKCALYIDMECNVVGYCFCTFDQLSSYCNTRTVCYFYISDVMLSSGCSRFAKRKSVPANVAVLP